MKRIVLKKLLFSATLLLPPALSLAAEPTTYERPIPVVTPDSAAPTAPEQILGALSVIESNAAWKPEANDEVSRGPAAEVYPKVAPATVVVRLPNGHGTGFLVGDDGWIVTNHHVASNGMTLGKTDFAGTQYCLIHLGHIEDGIMTVDEQPIPALVYKLDEQLDLALLKLTSLPKGVKKLPFVPLATAAPTPGSACVAIGHPKSGMLWTVRSGEVAGMGIWPKDMISVMLNYLSVAGTTKETMTKSLADAPKRKVVISSCGINPGDSGGPLVNEKGELVAVTFAIPKNEGTEVSLDKFSYHVHIDEVRKFLEDKPKTPPLHIPSVWPASTVSGIRDADEDGINDTWIFVIGNRYTGSMFDADEDSGENFLEELNAGKRGRDGWDAELVVQDYPTRRAFYDKNNDGKLDEILSDTDEDGKADVALNLIDGKWSRRDAKDQMMIDMALFADPKVGKRVNAVVQGKGKKAATGKPSAGKPAEKTATEKSAEQKAATPATPASPEK